MDKYKTFLTDLFFPKLCLGCRKEGVYLCDDCRSLLDIAEFNYCLCEAHGQPKRILPLKDAPLSLKCPKCQDKKLSGLYFALTYKENTLAQRLIYQFKYKPYLKDLAPTLASILAEHFILTGINTDKIWKNSVLVPVPLDKKKQKERGYNQSEKLAKELSKVLQIPVMSDVLVKIRKTPSQAKSKREERQKNLLGAFAINKKNLVMSDITKFSKVFLIDDVYTTGSTMEECARVLKDSGAKHVWGICLAREG